MGLFEFFFPAESQAISMKRMSENQSKMLRMQTRSQRNVKLKSKKQNHSESNIKNRVTNLEDDLGFLALLVAGIMTRLDEKQIVQKDDIREIIQEIDGFDGEEDGKLDINVLKGLSK